MKIINMLFLVNFLFDISYVSNKSFASLVEESENQEYINLRGEELLDIE